MTEHLDLATFLVRIKRLGAVQIDTRPGGGFRLKHHEADPNAPLSPIKINLSTPDVRKEGKLTKVDVSTVVRLIFEHTEKVRIHYDAVAGIPNSGNPIALGLVEENYNRRGVEMRRVDLSKIESGGKRHIGPIVSTGGMPRSADFSVLPVDDVAFHATTKEEAVEQLRLIYSVSFCAVFFDYDCGATEALERLRVGLLAVTTVPYALAVWRQNGDISQTDYDVVSSYLNNEKERWLAKVAA